MTTEITLIPARSIPKAIKAIHTDGQKLQTSMHTLACSVLKHLGKTKDVRHTLAFLQAMPEMSRLNSLKQWFEAYGPVRFPTAEERQSGAPEIMFVKDKKTLLGDAMGNPFWKFKAQEGVDYVAMDVAKEIERMLKRLKKDAEKTGVDHKGLIAGLQTAHKAYDKPAETAH